jgi:gliding motility-associated-like protein
LNKFDVGGRFTDLGPGDYSVIAQDGNGCFEQLLFTIEEPTVISAMAVTTPEICAGNGDGTISLTIRGGRAPYSTSIVSAAESDLIQGQTSFTGLAAGTYIVFVEDSSGCSSNLVARIDPGANLNADITPVYDCTGDIPRNSIELALEDASVSADILYALDSDDPGDMVLEPDFTDISPGTHYITLAHSNGCQNTVGFEIRDFEPLTLTLEQNRMNEITATVLGGNPDYTFFFNDKDNGSDNTYYIRRTGIHTVTVVDQNGCEAIAQMFMEFIDIEIPNFFTPDKSLVNDSWKPRNIQQFPKIDIKIFDRYGRVVCEMGINHKGWDGSYDGVPLPTGDYWYVVRPNGENDEREFVGHFTLFR